MALAIYITLFSAIAPAANSAYAAAAPYFSVTLIAPTTNPARRQYAAIIANSMRNIGIDAKVFYVLFDELQNRLFFLAAYNADGSVDWTKVGTDFAHGGYDVGFIGWGATGLSPDSSFSNFLGDYADWAPNGNNYYLYNSSVSTALMNDVYKTANVSRQIQDLWNLQAQIQQDVPQVTIYYNLWVIARDPALKDYGNASVWSEVTFPDVEHYSGKDTLTFAESGNVFPSGNLNPLPTTQSNSFYALFIYSPAFSSLQSIDSRDNSYYLALANSIKSTPDALNWTINFKPNNFQDGVAVTADDFVFTYQSLFDPNGGYVGQGTMLSQLGTKGVFTYLNGTSKVMDQTASGKSPTTWTVKAIDKQTFEIDLPELYSFMNTTWTAIFPLPKHYLEQFPISGWNSLGYSTATPYTVNWDASKYGGTGSWAAAGPFGNGPYIITKFDKVSNTANEVAWDGYWNATGLKSIGQYAVKNYNVVWISGADAAIAAFKQGTVQQLDTNYALGPSVATLQGIGANVLMGPELGYQEMGINMQNPIWGTGVDTPSGQANPANAAAAARHVRQAFSYLVPRSLIVANLLNGLGSPGITPWAPAYGQWFNPNLQPNAYDPTLATQELAQAGYSGGSALPPPPPPPIVQQNYLIAGLPVQVSGKVVDTSAGVIYNGTEMTLQMSYDKATWVDVASTVTSADGSYAAWFTSSQPGTVFLRWFHWPLVRGDVYSPVFNYTTITIGDALTQALTPYAQSSQVTQLQTSVSGLQSSMNSLSSQVTSLQSQLTTANYIGYGAIVIAIIAIILVFLMGRRKSQ
jgi:ABC-type transport system substrate-binding protein